MAKKTKVVVVTGASAGVGRATVREFARSGRVALALLARGREGLEEARREVEDAGGKALVIPIDVSDPAQVEQAAETVEREFGPIDVWVNCAMVSVFSPVREMTSEEYRRVTEVTYLGYVNGTLTALKRMEGRGRGVVVQVSSALGFRGIPLQSAYCAAKHAIVGFTESLRAELLHEKSDIRVTMVHLPSVNTPQFDQVRAKVPVRIRPVPPVFEPEVAARAIVWAAHHPRRRAITVGGSSLQVIFGNRVAPGLLDRILSKKGYSGQLEDAPADPNRPDNLWSPVPGDLGAHGRFGEEAKDKSPQTWLTTHRALLGAVCAVGAGSLALLRSGRARRLLPAVGARGAT
jgi:NAD(P)-dependent dehydrogenase (short-subunit alcohol dehydrogenase family)